MSKKNYIATAKILSEFRHSMDELVFDLLVGRFVTMFADDNPNFSPSKFREACYGT